MCLVRSAAYSLCSSLRTKPRWKSRASFSRPPNGLVQTRELTIFISCISVYGLVYQRPEAEFGEHRYVAVDRIGSDFFTCISSPCSEVSAGI